MIHSSGFQQYLLSSGYRMRFGRMVEHSVYFCLVTISNSLYQRLPFSFLGESGLTSTNSFYLFSTGLVLSTFSVRSLVSMSPFSVPHLTMFSHFILFSSCHRKLLTSQLTLKTSTQRHRPFHRTFNYVRVGWDGHGDTGVIVLLL